MSVASIALLSKNRAVSEIMASLTLLLVVVAVGTLLYSYSLDALGKQNIVLSQKLRLEGQRIQERFEVIAVWWGESGNLLNLSILNYGKLDIKIADAYINGERATSFTSGRNERIDTSTMGNLVFTSPMGIVSGTEYEMVIVSSRGTAHVHNWEP